MRNRETYIGNAILVWLTVMKSVTQVAQIRNVRYTAVQRAT